MRGAPLLSLWAACAAPEPLAVQAVGVDGRVEVQADAPLHTVEIVDADGLPVASRRLDPPLRQVQLPARWDPAERWTLRATAERGSAEVPVALDDPLQPFELQLQAPVGQDGQPVADGATLRFPLPVGGSATVGLLLRARPSATGQPLHMQLGEEEARRAALARGEGVLLSAVVAGPVEGRVQVGAVAVELRVEPDFYTPGAPGAPDLRIEATHFPCFPDGSPDALRPADRLDLPSPTWSGLLRAVGLGARGRDPWAAWAWQSVTLHNPGAMPANAVVRATVLDAAGQPAPAFRPRLREGDDGTGRVSVLVRVPAGGSARAVLPLFADAEALGGAPRSWTRRVEATLVGAPAPAATADRPLHSRTGRSAVSGGFLALLASAAAGGVLLALRLPRWLRGRTADLVTIALFGTLDFVLRTTAGLVGSAFAAVLGPFAILLTGLLDDVLHVGLLATLLTLLPRPGTAALGVVLGWLLRGLVTGGFGPQDLVFLCSKVALLEGGLWAAGLTRGGAWRDAGPLSRWARLSLGLAPTHAVSTGLALVGHMVFFRLFLADWYLAMVLLLPGFAYVLVATALATGLADSLRRVEP